MVSTCQICPEAVQIAGANRGGRQSSGISSGISNRAAVIVFPARNLLGEKGLTFGGGGGVSGEFGLFFEELKTSSR